jgi:hypothetical protein
MRSVQDPAGDVGADQVEQFVGAAGENRPDRVQREALCLLGGDRGRDRQLLTRDRDIDERGAVVGERIGQRLFEVAGLFDAPTEDADGLRDRPEVRDELLNTTTFTGRLLCTKVSSSPNSIVRPPSPARATT